MRRLGSPLRWYGGKMRMRNKLLPILESWPHRIYVEAFGGGASLLIAKRPVPVETYNDIDGGLVNFFRVISNPELFQKFYRRVAVLPYSRQLWKESKETWDQQSDPVERAVLWFVAARQSFSGIFGRNWSFSVSSSSRGMSTCVSGWLSAIKLLPKIHERLQRVQIENCDWRTCLQTYNTDETLFYLDPPYVPETRKKLGTYCYEMGTNDHIELVEAVQRLSGGVVLSGYQTEVYEPLEKAGWRRKQWRTNAYAVGRTRPTGMVGKGSASEKASRIECVWVNPRVAAACEELLK